MEWSETVAGIAKESAGDGEVADDDGVAMRYSGLVLVSIVCATRGRTVDVEGRCGR